MRTAGLAGRCPKRFRRTTIRSISPAAEPPDLVRRGFNPTAPNELWMSDITYVRTWEGWLYLAIILDAFSRRVVGWALADHLRTELATDALQMALTSRRPGPGLIHHSDRGGQPGFKGSSQHRSQELRCSNANVGAQIAHYEPECSHQAVRRWPVARTGNASGPRSKTELLHRAVWPTRQHAKTAIFHYIEGFHNRLRRHSTLNYQSPDAYEADYLAAILAA